MLKDNLLFCFDVTYYLDTNRFVQVDAYGPDDTDGRGRECSVKSWCGDDDACLLASLVLSGMHNFIPTLALEEMVTLYLGRDTND